MNTNVLMTFTIIFLSFNRVDLGSNLAPTEPQTLLQVPSAGFLRCPLTLSRLPLSSGLALLHPERVCETNHTVTHKFIGLSLLKAINSKESEFKFFWGRTVQNWSCLSKVNLVQVATYTFLKVAKVGKIIQRNPRSFVEFGFIDISGPLTWTSV